MPVPSTNTVLVVVGLTLAAGTVVVAVAAAYRWYFQQRISGGVALLAAVSVVALYLNTRVALGQAIEGQTDALAATEAAFNVAAFGAAAVVVPVALRAGDRIGVQALAATGTKTLEGEVSELVKTVGRAVAVELPEDIDDVDGYDPVSSDVKRELAGKSFIFPRRLTVEELRTRVVTRLKDDYEVGYVDVELDADGSVSYLALGRRAAGIGPTLAPGTAAVAVRADPPAAAGAGDLVQVWRNGETPERVTTGELRATAGDVTTLAVDEVDAPSLAGGDYRLLTLPYEPGADRQFAALLRGADETMAAVHVEAGSDLDGAAVAHVEATVVAVRSSGGVDAVPNGSRALGAGDTLYVVARPDVVRRIEAAAAPADADAP